MSNTTTRSNPIYQLFHALKVKDLLEEKKQTIVTLKSSDSVEKAVKVLSENKILSAPVMDKKTDTCLGLIDMTDILKYVVNATPSLDQLKADELENLQIAGRAIALMSIENIVDFSGSDPIVDVVEESPVSQLLEYFATGIHRVVVFNAETKAIANIVTQSDVVRYLANHIHIGKTKNLGESKLEDLGYSTTTVFTVGKTKTVLEALQIMVTNGLSAIAVVDEEDGRLIGNFSASNLRGLYRTKFPDFLLSVEDFLTKYSIDSLNPICTVASNSLSNVVKEFATSKIHHIWIVADFKPVGVVSLTDVMKISLSEQ